jgi:aminoacyl-tRNA hydrolase
MQPVSTPEGVTFIRDDYKAPLWTVDACFEFVKTARAKRKIIVIGELQDIASQKGAKYAKTAIRAQEIADIVIFVGPWASSVLKTRKPGREDVLRAFSHVHDAAQYVNSIARDGDLVLLKGANRQDHLVRIIMARSGAIACWRNDCNRYSFCNECPDRNKPSGLSISPGSLSLSGVAPQVRPPVPKTIKPEEQVIVGLGNPESKYTGTPHNIGYEVVDHIAQSLGLDWEATPEAWIARGSWQGRSVCLIKIRTAMNNIGTGLKQLAERVAFDPERCILVHDELDMSVGSVRARMNGGAGGHQGVASILMAFETDAFRRVKVGVGQAPVNLGRAAYVLTPFAATDRAAIDRAILTAKTRMLEMVEHASTASEL